MAHGSFSWNELLTTDPKAAQEFYSKLFGWSLEKANTPGVDPAMDYTMINVEQMPVGGIAAIPKDAKGMPPHWGSYVTVDDIDATAKLAEQLGARILRPPTDIPGIGRFAVLQDPQGAIISAITYVQR